MSYIGNQPFNATFVTDTFSGTGSQTVYTLSVGPGSGNAILVAISGILQPPSSYAVVGQILTFSSAPPVASNNISVRYLALPASSTTTSAYRNYTEITASAGQTTFSPASYTPGFIDVFRNGVRLHTTNYTASNGSTVVLANAASAGDTIAVVSFYVSSVLNAIPNTAGSVGASNYDISGQGGSGAIQLPTGTTAQRPVSPTNGMLRKNTTTGYIEYWDPSSSSWVGIGAFSAIGGASVFTYTSGPTTYKVHQFTSSDTFQVLSGTKTVDYMIIGGGGGGGTLGGGGGAGGYLTGSFTTGAGSYGIVIGSGANGGSQGAPGGTGGNTTAFGLTAFGGGGGGSHTGGATSVAGTSGGSGGGSGDNASSYPYGAGTAGQGNRGGTGSAVYSNIPRGGGGGGGAGGVGFDISSPSSAAGGAGGPGVLNAINGTSYYWAGGGGYGGYSAGSRGGDGGIGGGGGGSCADTASPAGAGGGSALNNGTAGTAANNVIGGLGGQNTGGGGGGNGWSYNNTGGRSGGSGIVIIRYTI